METLTAIEPGYFALPAEPGKAREIVFLRRNLQTAFYSADLERFWYLDPLELIIFDAKAKKIVAQIAREDKDGRVKYHPNGKTLFLLEDADETTYHQREDYARSWTITVIDLRSGDVDLTIEHLPNILSASPYGRWPTVSCDESGVCYFPAEEGIAGHRRTTLVTLKPEDGSVEIQHLLGDDIKEMQPAVGLAAFSPDGRYCLRSHFGALRSRQKTKRKFGLFSVPDGPKEYAVECQLWQTNPLRFVKVLVVDWVIADQVVRLNKFTIKDPDSRRVIAEAMMDCLVQATADQKDAYLEGCPRSVIDGTYNPDRLEEDYPADWSNMLRQGSAPEKHWNSELRTYHEEFRRQVVGDHGGLHSPVWTKDESAIWFKTKAHFVCIDLHGNASQRYELGDFWGKSAKVTPRQDRLVKIEKHNGWVELDGKPVERSLDLPAVALVETPISIHPSPELEALKKQVKLLRKESEYMNIRLKDWSSEELAKGLKTIAAGFRGGTADLATNQEFEIRFFQKRKRVEAQEFWTHVRDHGRDLTPLLADAIEAFMNHTGLDDLYLVPDEGISTFAEGVETLARLDTSFLMTTIRRYGEFFDSSHHYVFYGEIVMAALSEHGLTVATIPFALWAMVTQSGNGGYASLVWDQHGLGKKLRGFFSPEETIDLFQSLNLKSDQPRGLEILTSCLEGSDNPWDRAVLTKLSSHGSARSDSL